MAEKKGHRKFVIYGIGVLILALVAGGIYFLIQYFEKPPQARKQVQQISLIKPPPPPPPEEPPPPPPPEEEVDIPEPEELPEELPEPADEPPAGDLGLDADGTAGSDGFGLAGRKGGRGLLGGDGDPKTRFASLLKRRIEDVLAEYDSVRSRNYKVKVRFRISGSGQVSATLLDSTGDPELDATIRQALSRAASVQESPPQELLGSSLKFRIGV